MCLSFIVNYNKRARNCDCLFQFFMKFIDRACSNSGNNDGPPPPPSTPGTVPKSPEHLQITNASRKQWISSGNFLTANHEMQLWRVFIKQDPHLFHTVVTARQNGENVALQSNLYITVILGKWPGDRYVQGDHYKQVSFKLYWKLMNNVLMWKYSNHSSTFYRQ